MLKFALFRNTCNQLFLQKLKVGHVGVFQAYVHYFSITVMFINIYSFVFGNAKKTNGTKIKTERSVHGL
jgi:hypothetical protein